MPVKRVSVCLHQQTIQLNIADTIYLCSDGYIRSVWREVLIRNIRPADLRVFYRVIQEYSMPEQSDRLYEEIERWREENQ